MHETLSYRAKLKSFCSLDLAAAKGMPVLWPSTNDYLVFQDKYSREEDGESKDVVKSWGHAKNEFSPKVLQYFQEVQRDLYGDPKLMSDSKPQMQEGELCGSIAIEQTYRSQFHVRNANRAYHTTVSYQDAHSLEAPHVSNKVDGVREKDAANMLRQCLNELTVCNANAGLAKGAPNLLPLMKEWAEVDNYPKPGGFNRYKDFGTESDNPCWTASQTNCASTVSSDAMKLVLKGPWENMVAPMTGLDFGCLAFGQSPEE
ncbi:hypothetical protein F5146DRAFT_1145160 [Armillaria mellea]|nr:hypothetical protein F5146DRAFT_1145160 [Armillaria mellea]